MDNFFAKMLPRKYAIERYFIFPPHLTSACALPVESGNQEILVFRKKHTAFK